MVDLTPPRHIPTLPTEIQRPVLGYDRNGGMKTRCCAPDKDCVNAFATAKFVNGNAPESVGTLFLSLRETTVIWQASH